MSGVLEVERKYNLFEMNFPSRVPEKIDITEQMIEVIGLEPLEAYLSRDLLLVLKSESQVKNLSPDFSKMLALADGLGVITTAQSQSVDFVSRCFYPKLGVNEDPVTGSAHSNLIPFWASKLNKTKMIAKQLSEREGILYCELLNDRVKISGTAVLYLQGEIHI